MWLNLSDKTSLFETDSVTWLTMHALRKWEKCSCAIFLLLIFVWVISIMFNSQSLHRKSFQILTLSVKVILVKTEQKSVNAFKLSHKLQYVAKEWNWGKQWGATVRRIHDDVPVSPQGHCTWSEMWGCLRFDLAGHRGSSLPNIS